MEFMEEYLERMAYVWQQQLPPRPFYVFGAGALTEKLLARLQNHPVRPLIRGIIDNSPHKWGTNIAGITVYPRDIILEFNHPLVFINVTRLSDEYAVQQALQVLHPDTEFIYSPFSRLNNKLTIDEMLFEFATRKSPRVFVYQVGKVGSKTILHSLFAQNIDAFHVHILVQKWTNWKANRDFKGSYAELVQQTVGSREKIKIISLMRDPVSRNMAAFFQNLDYFIPNAIATYDSGQVDAAQLVQMFFEQYPHEVPFIWWQDELNAVFGIDIFAQPFDRERGYSLYENEHVELLLIKLESLNDCFSNAVHDFFGLENVPLVHENVGDNKEYSHIYKAFKEQIVFSDEYLDKMYASPVTTYFYKEAEIAKLRAKWRQ
jgi:hypothetical protein